MKVSKETIDATSRKLAEVLLKKNTDYGDAVSSPPFLAPNLDAGTALLVRMSDKTSRIRNLIETGRNEVNESLKDSVLDLAGYCLLYLIVTKKGSDNEM